MGWVQQPLWLFLIISLAEKISFKTFNAQWTCCVMKSSLSYLWPAAPWQLCHSREHSAEQNQLLTVSCHSSHLQRRDGHWIQWTFLLRSRGDCWEQWKQAALLQKLWGCAWMGQSKTQGNCGCCRRCHCDKSLYGGKKKRALNQEWKRWGEEQKGRKKNHPEMSCLLHPCGKYSSWDLLTEWTEGRETPLSTQGQRFPSPLLTGERMGKVGRLQGRPALLLLTSR